MTFYYRPTVTEAFSSVQYIMTEANFGWLIRSVHRWSASMMVLMMILHVFRVYLTGGFKKPRELTWVTGVVLAVLTASFGVTGYSLPWDQIGYWAVKIVTGVPEAIPVIGSPLVELLRGSASVGQSTLTRFYSLHTFVLPLLTAVFSQHILLFRGNYTYLFSSTSRYRFCYDFLLPTDRYRGFFLRSIYNDGGQLWLVNPIGSSMVSKYDGSNDDPARISCVSHRWI